MPANTNLNYVVINSHFVADFNKGRNVVHNLKALALLYDAFNKVNEEEKTVLCKPIVVFIGAIVEAVLYDFHYRIHSFTREGVASLPLKALHAIRSTSTKKDELWWLIKKCEDNEVFGPKDHQIYNQLKDLRLLRNRFHIQNKENSFEEYEIEAFSQQRKQVSEKTLEFILRIMTEKYGRSEELKYVDDYVLPWKSHFSAGR